MSGGEIHSGADKRNRGTTPPAHKHGVLSLENSITAALEVVPKLTPFAFACVVLVILALLHVLVSNSILLVLEVYRYTYAFYFGVLACVFTFPGSLFYIYKNHLASKTPYVFFPSFNPFCLGQFGDVPFF